MFIFSQTLNVKPHHRRKIKCKCKLFSGTYLPYQFYTELNIIFDVSSEDIDCQGTLNI